MYIIYKSKCKCFNQLIMACRAIPMIAFHGVESIIIYIYILLCHIHIYIYVVCIGKNIASFQGVWSINGVVHNRTRTLASRKKAASCKSLLELIAVLAKIYSYKVLQELLKVRRLSNQNNVY